jgi:zinc/manganese transport system substrate-binding protein
MSRILLSIFLSFPLLLQAKPLTVVTSFSILKDFVQQVGQDKVGVQSIVGPNGDAHVYEPTPLDVRQIAEADLVIINGLGFEGWIERLVQASGFKGPLVVAAKKIHPRLVFEGRLVEDPHAWHSVQNAIVYVHEIRDALIEADPKNRTFYEQNAENYIEKLMTLDGHIRKEFARIPPKNRKIITAHDAFGYFGNSYGIEFLSPIGTNTESEPCAKDMVKLIEAIKELGVKTIFIENITNPKLIEQVANETGATVGNVIYSDALSEQDAPAPTYIHMIQYNASLFLRAMKEI